MRCGTDLLEQVLPGTIDAGAGEHIGELPTGVPGAVPERVLATWL
jgi:hypothetical protein